MKNVYLSYHASARLRAQEVRRILLAQGYRPWIDRSPVAGQAWHVEIDTAIQQADALVMLLTDEAADSLYMTYEFAYALGGNVPVFAIIFDDVRLHPSLFNVQRFDYRSFSDENHFWDHFVGSSARLSTKRMPGRSPVRLFGNSCRTSRKMSCHRIPASGS